MDERNNNGDNWFHMGNEQQSAVPHVKVLWLCAFWFFGSRLVRAMKTYCPHPLSFIHRAICNFLHFSSLCV